MKWLNGTTEVPRPAERQQLSPESQAGDGRRRVSRPDKAGGDGRGLPNAEVRKDFTEVCHSNRRQYSTGSARIHHADAMHCRAMSGRKTARPLHLNEPAQWSAPGGPIGILQVSHLLLDEDPLPFPMGIVSVMVLVLVMWCRLSGTRRAPTRWCLRLCHSRREVYGDRERQSRSGKQ